MAGHKPIFVPEGNQLRGFFPAHIQNFRTSICKAAARWDIDRRRNFALNRRRNSAFFNIRIRLWV